MKELIKSRSNQDPPSLDLPLFGDIGKGDGVDHREAEENQIDLDALLIQLAPLPAHPSSATRVDELDLVVRAVDEQPHAEAVPNGWRVFGEAGGVRQARVESRVDAGACGVRERRFVFRGLAHFYILQAQGGFADLTEWREEND